MVLLWGCKNFDKNFAPVWKVGTFFGNIRSSFPIVISRKVLRVLLFQSHFKTTKSTLLLLFSKASKLGFDNLCLCGINVLSENVLISSIKSLTMPLNNNCPSSTNCKDIGSCIYFLRQAFEGLHLWRSFGWLTWHRCWVKNIFSKTGL
jgi:hypothetical protein